MARLRTFVAIDPGKAVRDRLVALQEALARGGAEVKWVEHDNLHVTLLFLGEVNDTDVPAVCGVVAEEAGKLGAFALSVEGAGCFPHARRPRIVWAGLQQGRQEVCVLHDALEPPLLELGCYRREERKYTPHITLGRVRNERASAALAVSLARHTGWMAGETMVREVHVLSSELTPHGPIYTVLSRAKLGVQG